MNELEKLIFGGDTRWYFLDRFDFDEKKRSIEIAVSPNDESTSKRVFLFSNVKNVRYEYDHESDFMSYPKQILGVDWNQNCEVVINCSEVEYFFDSLSKPELKKHAGQFHQSRGQAYNF